MEQVLPVLQTVFGLLVTSFLVPWLRKKNKLDGATWIATIASDVLGRVYQNNKGKTAIEIADLLAKELVAKLKISEKVARDAAAGAVLRAGLK